MNVCSHCTCVMDPYTSPRSSSLARHEFPRDLNLTTLGPGRRMRRVCTCAPGGCVRLLYEQTGMTQRQALPRRHRMSLRRGSSRAFRRSPRSTSPGQGCTLLGSPCQHHPSCAARKGTRGPAREEPRVCTGMSRERGRRFRVQKEAPGCRSGARMRV